MMSRRTWNLEDFLTELRQVRKQRDSLEVLIERVRRKRPDCLSKVSWEEVVHAEAIISSMTPEERRRPERIDAGRVKRIANGSGTYATDVIRLLREYHHMRRSTEHPS